MQLNPYLFFEGKCEAALEFYKRVLKAEVQMMMRFGESPEPESCAGADPKKIMHACVKIGQSSIMMSDGRASGKADFQGFSLSLNAASAEEAERLFAALSDGGKVQMPMMPTFWSPRFGMVADRFGVSWMVMAMPA